MIAVDTNLLVYAHRKDSPWHAGAVLCISKLAEGRMAWTIPWPCIHEFLAVVTHPRTFTTPTSLEAAVDQIEAWLESPSLTLLAEGRGFWDHLATQLVVSRAAGPVVHDARVAALCLGHGVAELWSADRDFGRFPDLRVRNPLVGMEA